MADDQKDLRDFTSNKLREKGIISSPTENDFISDANVGAGSTVGLGNNQKLQYIAVNELPGISTRGAEDINTPRRNIELPGITYKPANQNDNEIDEKYKRIRAENIQLDFLDNKERNEKYGDQVNSETGVLFEQGARQRWKNARGAVSQFGTNTLESIVDNRIRNMERAGFDMSKDKEYVKNIQNKNLEYKKKINSAFKTWQKNNVNQKLADEYEGKTFTELVRNGDTAGFKYKFTKLFADNISLLPNIVITTINTPVGLTLMTSDAYIQESENEFEDLMRNGATYEEARNGAFWVGAINAGIEMWLEKTLGIIGPASRGLRNLIFKNVRKEVVRAITKKTLPEIIYRAGKAQIKSAIGEGSEELLQEIVGNIFVHMVNDERGILDNIWESFEAGAIMGLFVPGGALESVTKDVQSNKKVDIITDLEALDYVMQGEQRKNQRIEQQKIEEAKERLKKQILSKKRANTWGEVEEVNNQMQESEESEISNSKDAVEQEMIDEITERKGSDVEITDESYQQVEKTNKPTDNINQIDKDIKDIKDSLENMDDNEFFDRIQSSINKGDKRNFVVIRNNNGQKTTLRVVKRGGKGKNQTVTIQVMKPSEGGKVSVSNFTYNPGNLTTQQKQGIIGGLQNWIAGSEFSDNTRYQLKYEEKGYNPGVAGKNEKNISGKEGIKLRNKINDETIEQLAKKYGVRVDVIKGLIKILRNGKWNGKDYAYGKYIDNVLTLSEQIKESTAPHELLHAIFDMIDPETKVYLISQVMKSEGWSAKKAEEWLADSFSNFFRTGKIEGAPKSTWGKIKIFFKRVRSFINGLGKWRSELEEIFTNIITSEDIEDLQGKIDSSEKLNEAKERMRERFKQYVKNAQKIESKSEEKYQKTGKNEENEYTNDGKDTVQSVVSSSKEDESIQDVSFFSKVVQKNIGRKYLRKQWELFRNGELWESHVRKGDEFSNLYDLGLKKGEEKYLKEFNDFVKGNIPEATIGKIKIGNNTFLIKLDEKSFYHLFRKHGDFSPNNLIATTNNPDYKIIDVKVFNEKLNQRIEVKDKINLIKILDDNHFLVVGANLENGYYIATHFEVVQKKGDELIELLNRGKAMDQKTADYMNTHYQTAGDIESEAFKKRFGDSKVVDKDGNPLIVYHGTADKFTVFNRKFDGKNTGNNGLYGNGFYFTNDIETAKFYGGKRVDLPLSDYDNDFVKRDKAKGEKSNIMGVYLKMEKPFYWKSIKNANQVRKLMNLIHVRGLKWNDYLNEMRTIVDDEQAINFRKGLDNAGYDGIIYEGDNGNEYAVFYPNQIKSATDNVGTYDPNNDDIRYQLPTEIDPNIQSPNEMIHKRGQLMVIEKFISEEQKKKALDVSKDILVHDGSHLEGLPYMWAHTNKYDSNMIADFQNRKDNKYKEFSDQGIVVSFFTNNLDMSKSYADQRSKLANTKKFNSIEEFNERFNNISQDGTEIDSSWRDDGVGKQVRHEYYKRIEKDGDEYVLKEHDLEGHKYEDLKTLAGNWGATQESEKEIIDYIENRVTAEFISDPNFHLYDSVEIRKDKNGEYIMDLVADKELGRYKSEKEALARGRSKAMQSMKYHYEGIIQNMHNPLVVDKEIYGNTTPNWNRLGNAYDFLEKMDKEQLNKIVDAIDDVYNRQEKLGKEWNKLSKRSEKLRDAMTKELNDNRMDNFTAKANKDENEIARTNHRESEIWSKREKFDSIIEKLELALHKYYDLTDTAKEVMESYLNEYDIKEWRSLYNDYMKLISEYKEFYSLDGGEKFEAFAKKKYGVDDATLSLLHGIDGVISDNGEKVLKDKWMQTNDFVFYALRKGGYDGVIFGRIYDYGGDNIESKWGGNVLVTFNPNQFKSWDNADPTDSEFISYQLADDLESEAFKKRFGDSKVVDENGNPLVVYHGTPNGEFWSFNKRKASTEGDRGAGFYFTDNEYDVGNNYVGGGPDFDNKVARLAERIEQDEGISYEEAKEKAREQLYIGDNQIDAVLKIENPVRVGEDATDIIGEWRDNAVEEYNEEDFDNEDDYYRALDEARANALDDIHRAIWNIGLDYGIDDAIQTVDQRFMENDYGTAQQLKDYINQNVETEMDGQLANNEVARAVLEGLGYDGIIDNSVSYKFSNMGLDSGTTHYIVFEPNQIKSATDNVGTYDPNNEDIRYQEMDSDQKDNEGRTLSIGQVDHFKDSKARVDEDLDRPLVRVRHTTTDPLIRPFSIFNPVGTPHYRFGEQIVNYYTDDEGMSASYADGSYSEYDAKGEVRSLSDAKKYLEKLKDERRIEFRTGDPMRYTLKKEGNGYRIYNDWDNEEINDMEELWKEANLTKEEEKVLQGIYEERSVWDYGRKVLGDRYEDNGMEGEFGEIKKNAFTAEEKLLETAEERGTPFGKKYGLSNFYRSIFEHRKNPGLKDTGMYFETEKDLIDNLENELIARQRASNKRQYVGYVNLTNPYIVDAEGRNWDTVRMGRTLLEDILDRWNKNSKADKDRIIKVFEDAKQEFEEGEEIEGWDWYSYGMRNENLKDAIHEVMGNTLMLELDASNEMYGAQIVGDAVDTVLGGMKEEDIQQFLNHTVGNSNAETTNDVVKFVIESNKKGKTNYDGVIIKNVLDYGSEMEEKSPHNVYVTFASNQFKSMYNLNPTDNEDIRYQTVYHGSQAEFDRFDSSHMGEGEGAQAHGWGHYVAVEKDTGRHYADMGGDPSMGYKGESWNNLLIKGNDPEYYIPRIVIARMDEGMSFAEARNWKKRNIEHDIENIENSVDKKLRTRQLEELKKQLEILNSLKADDFQKVYNRHFYEVEIPDPEKANTPTGKNYIEEGKKLTEKQWNKFRDAVEKIDDSKKYKMSDGTPINIDGYYPGETDTYRLYRQLSQVLGGDKEASKFLASLGYKGIHYFGGRDGEAYVIFNDDDLEITNHEKYQIAEYDYDENGNRKWLKFGEDNSEFDPSIFGENTREEQIEEDKDREKNNSFYDAWMKYNNQNYKEDQLTMKEFLDGVMNWSIKKQEEFDQKMRDLSEAQNDPVMLDLQLRAVKLMEEEGNVGKKFGKNVSKEVRDKQQAEVERKREELIKDIFDWMYPGLSFEDATYDDQKMADQKEAEWEMLGRENIENKLKYFRKDSNGNWVAKGIKIEDPQAQWDKIVKSGNYDEVFAPVDRVLKWKTPQGQHGTLDSVKDPKQYKKVMEKINNGTTKTKVTLTDVTQEARALEKQKAMEEEEKERKKKEKAEAMAKKKQDEYRKLVRMRAFQKLVDMQRFEKYPFLTEKEIQDRYGFTDEEWKIITEQQEIKLPKKRGDKAISDFNKAVDSQVKLLIEGLSRQNTTKRKDAERNLGEIGEIDLDVLLGRDEEKGAKEVEEFENLAEEEKKKSKNEKNKRLEQAREDVTKVEIDKERENSKSEKERVDKLIKSTKSDNTVWGSIKKFTSDILTPVSTKIKEISPKIYREVMRYFQNKDILTNQRLKEVDPFLKAMGKIRKENPVRFMDIWVALANRNIGYANGLLEEYGVKVPTKLLDTIYDEVEDVGLNMNYLGSYYPLSVKAPKSFMEELMKTGKGDIASEIEKKIQQESQKKGGPLEESEITAIINSIIAGEEKGPDVNTGNKHMKKRNTEIKWTPKMLEYCDDPISTLIGYIEGMTQSIERAKFLGKSRSGNVHTLADYVYNAKNGLTPDQQDELMDLLKAVFNDDNPNKFIQTWRDIATLTTLGSPSSTLTQIGDLSFSIYENGWREALKATWDIFMKRKAFNLVDMGVLNRGEEYTNINSQKNLLQKAIHNVFKLTFFSQFDTFGKSAYIQSTWNKRVKRAKKGENGDPQLRKDIMKWTNDEYMTDKIINDLKNNKFSQEVALIMYMKLGNIQPLTRAQMPKAYLNNPNGRLFYQFKTFGIKQLDYVLQETRSQMKNFKNLSTTEKFLRVAQVASMIFIMTLMGAGASELKDITMRRRSNSLILRWLFGEEVGSDQIWDKIGDSALQLFGLSRYTVMQMKSDPVDAITNLFTTFPATNLIMYPFKDINKAFKNDGSINWSNPSSYQLIPVIGKYRYWIYGGGQEKQQETLDKEHKKNTPTTNLKSRSTRNTRNTRSSNRNTRNSR